MTQATALDVCTVRWWKGYVKGRFHAYVHTSPPELAAESRAFRWNPPAPTAEAKAALDELSAHLAAEGWTAAGREGDEWFELAFTRPSFRPVAVEPPARDEEHGDPGDLDSELLEQLRDEVREARAEAAKERRARLAAEAEANRQPPRLAAVPAPAEAPPAPARRSPPRSASLLALYAVAVAAAAAGMYVGFHSAYAAAVAALTVAAVALGLDSWRVARTVSR